MYGVFNSLEEAESRLRALGYTKLNDGTWNPGAGRARIGYPRKRLIPYHQQFLLQDAGPPQSPAQVPKKRGRPPKPLLQKLLEKIEIDGYPGLIWSVPEFPRKSPEQNHEDFLAQWPNEFFRRWVWRGATRRIQRDHTQPYPVVQHNGCHISPSRALYELVVEDIPERHLVRLTSDHNQVDALNVNPLIRRAKPIGRQARANLFRPEDFESAPDTQVEEETPDHLTMSAQDVADMAEAIEERMIRKPLPTWEDFWEEFEVDLFDVTWDDIYAILRKAGLYNRYFNSEL